MFDKLPKVLLGSRHVNLVCLDAVGLSRGILVLWDSWRVAVSSSWKLEFPVTAFGL